MAKSGLRHYENVDQEVAHELADCLWSVLVIADELKIDLEPEFLHSMEDLKLKIASKLG